MTALSGIFAEREIGDGTGALGFDRRMTMTNAYGLMSRPTSSGGLWANDAVTYDYDNLGRRNESALNNRIVTFGYDNLSRLNAVAYTWNSSNSDWDLQSEQRFIVGITATIKKYFFTHLKFFFIFS